MGGWRTAVQARARQDRARRWWLLVVLVVALAAGACLPVPPPLATVSGRPVRWHPCGVIRYQIDPTGMPTGWSYDVHDAFRAASAATGIAVRYEGVYPHGRPHDRATDPVLVSYVPVSGTYVGYARPHRVGNQYVGGIVQLDAPQLGSDRARYRSVAFHEVGHVFGLDHAAGQSQLFSVMGTAAAPYRQLDLDAFREVGRRGTECR
jgi:hypothetical protein